MSNLKIVDNNAETTVAVQLLAGGTTLTVATGEGALFSTVAAPNIMNLTLDGANGIEIVQVTTHTAAADTFTIARAQEGTVAVQYEIGEIVELRLTKVYLDSLIQVDNGGNAKGVDSINIQPGRSSATNVASGLSGIVIGRNSRASATNSIGIGTTAIAGSTNAIAIGASSICSNNDSISIGSYSKMNGDQSVSLGSYAYASANRAMCFGYRSITNVARTNNISNPIIVRDNYLAPSINDGAKRTEYGSSVEILICTEAIQTTSTSDTQINLPADFFISEAGALAVDIDTITTQPTLAFGTTAILTDIVSPTLTTALTAVGKRARFTSPSLTDTAITTSLFGRVTTAATATSLKVRFYVKGFMVKSSPNNY